MAKIDKMSGTNKPPKFACCGRHFLMILNNDQRNLHVFGTCCKSTLQGPFCRFAATAMIYLRRPVYQPARGTMLPAYSSLDVRQTQSLCSPQCTTHPRRYAAGSPPSAARHLAVNPRPLSMSNPNRSRTPLIQTAHPSAAEAYPSESEKRDRNVGQVMTQVIENVPKRVLHRTSSSSSAPPPACRGGCQGGSSLSKPRKCSRSSINCHKFSASVSVTAAASSALTCCCISFRTANMPGTGCIWLPNSPATSAIIPLWESSCVNRKPLQSLQHCDNVEHVQYEIITCQ